MCGCEGAYRPHPTASPDPSTVDIRAVELLASQGRGDTAATETRAAVATQTQEVPWFFARTNRHEGFQREDNNGAQGHVPMVHHERFLQMTPWAETPATVIRTPARGDDGLGASACR